jgi:predicted enzyme related to lactoylglutathione lyase
MTVPLLRKVDCVRIPVPDLEAGLAFYRDRLGHSLVWRTDVSVGLRLPDSRTEVVLYTEPEGIEVDFLVDSAEAAARAIEQAGGRVVEGPFDIQIGRCVLAEDPFGNRFVVLDMSRGMLVTDATGNVVGVRPPGDAAGQTTEG